MSKELIAVLKGGPSVEREVSLRSGAACAAALRRAGWDVYEVDVRGPRFRLRPGTAVAFLALHGTFGEDGAVQRLLEARGVAYTGCGVRASHDCFDKVRSKQIFVAAGVPTPAYEVVARSAGARPSALTLRPPLVVKPACQGSSVGVTIVRRNSGAAVARALKTAFRHGDRAVVEPFVDGRELTVGIFDGRALPVVEIRPRRGFYDYRNKYTQGATEYLVPAPLPRATTLETQRVALAAFHAAGCRDYARVDLRLSRRGQPFVLEINTLPGMTAMSLLPKAAAAAGIAFEQLCSRMVQMALERRPHVQAMVQ
ncbi:MAG: D-alanine--D-alanine ligase [Verrucomicrobiae bacterium]|nr:D-alanine--D-alanine ligase [Verrucomicrobiae bacterium]